MTVQITKHGTLPTEKLYSATCPNCRTEFVFQKKDAKFQSCQREGSWLEIQCPLPGCNEKIILTL